MDITNVINHKRTFSVECQRPLGSAAFVLASPEDGKYVWRMCVQQHTFYMRHRTALSAAPDEPRPNFQVRQFHVFIFTRACLHVYLNITAV